MMRISFFAVLVIASPCAAQTPPKLDVRFPVIKVEAVPATTPTRLTGADLYVIDSDAPVIVLASPLGLVSITEEAGPIKIRSLFVDGTKAETRTYKGKQVFLIEAAATGTVELLVIPKSATASAADVIRKTLQVDQGIGPRPPPDPPKPTETALPLDGKFRVLIVEEKADRSKLTAGQQAAIFGVPVRNWLDGRCAVGPDGKTREYRIFDKDTSVVSDAATWRKAMEFVATKKLTIPAIVVNNGRDEFAGPLPKDDVFPLLKKMAGE